MKVRREGVDDGRRPEVGEVAGYSVGSRRERGYVEVLASAE